MLLTLLERVKKLEDGQKKEGLNHPLNLIDIKLLKCMLKDFQ